jgi:ABC-type branched-subunit amino acid transport system substrate-binding protein
VTVGTVDGETVMGSRAAVLFLLLAPLAAVAAGLGDPEQRGRRIYMEGKGRHKVSAFLLSAGIKAPGAAFPCINCHLAGGTGQLEGGVQSADITWFQLTKEFSGTRPSGRAHPPYDEESFMAAITGGLDPAGNELDVAHPRYDMEREDLLDLVAFIKVMDRAPVPGVTDNEVRVGILLPERGPLAGAGKEAAALLFGFFSEANSRGGVYGRRLLLVPVGFDPARPGSAGEAARDRVEKEELFCFLANVGVGGEDEAARYLAGERVPVIAPLLAAPESGYTAGRYTFHILASIRDQARVMADFLADMLPEGKRRAALLHSRDRHGEAGAEGAREQAEMYGIGLSAELSFAPGEGVARETVERLREEGAQAILFFGGGRDAVSFLREAGASGWRPVFVAPAQMVGDAVLDLPEALLENVYVATPFAPPDPSSRRVAEFFRIREERAVGKEHLSFQLLAYAGALLLEEGLKRAGRGVTRESFVEAIGNVWKLETGVTPPLTYDPNRRGGALGAAILKADGAARRYVPAVPWREPG